MGDRSKLVEARKRGFVPLTTYTSATGLKGCYVKKLVMDEDGDICGGVYGLVYNAETDKWATITE